MERMEEEETDSISGNLGFKPQKELIYNKFLPYSDQIEKEAQEFLKNIKTNLCKSILAREMRPGFAYWSARFAQYLNLYGLMFSKEDHIHFIKLYLEVMTVENQEVTRILRCINVLTVLLRKRHILSRDDLQIEWRPLYDLTKKVTDNSKIEIGMYKFPASLDGSLGQLIRLCRVYFPASATKEMLEEFKVKVCPLNASDMSTAVEYMEAFLPVCVKPEEACISYELWLKEFIDLWNSCLNDNTWENLMMWLMARVSCNNIGYVNWDPYVSIIYARVTRSLQLPVHYRHKLSVKTHKIDITASSLWIISTLNSKSGTTFFHLEKLMKTLKSYLYSANSGRWTLKLKELLNKLSHQFVNRIYCERYKKHNWENRIPDDYKLSDADIERFVLILKPCLEQAMFCIRATGDVSSTFQNLAALRPDLIVPMTLDRLYSSLDSLTEPHKLVVSMLAVVAVAREMVQGAQFKYPEGPTHIIPLLRAVLPGIDSNDLRKTFTTFHFISQFICMIPIVNASEASRYYDDLTEEEMILCAATAEFEDFVLQFFDRMLVWVSSQSLEFVRPEHQSRDNNTKNTLESAMDHAASAVVGVVLRQCSPEIYTASLKKVFNFVTSNVFEINISGKMVGMLCGCFTKINAEESLRLFVPYFCDRIEALFDENSNIDNEEHLDGELLYYLSLLSEVLDGRTEIAKYLDRLMRILDKTLYMTAIQGNRIGSHMLSLLLLSLSTIHPWESRSCEQPYSSHIKDFLPIRAWGNVIQAKELKVNWYIPQEKEIETIKILIHRYLVPEIEKLNNHASNESILPRPKLIQSLRLVASMMAAHTVFPMWEEAPLILMDTIAVPNRLNLTVGSLQTVSMPDGSNIRKTIADTLHKVQERILNDDEGDTKSLCTIISLYNLLIFNKIRPLDFEQTWKTFITLKKLLKNRLAHKKSHLRHVLIDRVTLQQLFRIENISFTFGETHKQILFDLFTLSICRYDEIRILAQSKLLPLINSFPYSYRLIIPQIKEVLLSDTEKEHEKFKGCLHILTSPKGGAPIITKHDWEFIKEIWPLVVNSKPSEKQSVVNLITGISDAVVTNFPTISIDFKVPEYLLTTALNLIKHCDISQAELDSIASNSEEKLEQTCKARRENYLEGANLLLHACNNKNLHWRYQLLAIGFLRDMVHMDIKYSTEAIRYFLYATINDSINIRKIALKVSLYILIQNKPKFKKTEIDPYSFSPNASKDEAIPGLRPDNEWLLYNRKNLPTTSEQWNELRYLENETTGYYLWPKKVEVYAPYEDQPSIVREPNGMTQEQREIFNFFSNAENVEQIIKYFSLEEKKGKDQFHPIKFLIFKNLFKMFEDKLLPVFIPHIEKLAVEKQESSQRCAAEFLGGLIQGSKHWSFEQVQNMWSVILPILHGAYQNVLTETAADWTLSICTGLQGRDPSRHYWLIEYLMKEPLSDPTSFIASNKLHLLNSALNRHVWRNVELFSRLLDYLKSHLSHPFQNIRTKISTSLKIIFMKDFNPPNGNNINSPTVAKFFEEIMPSITTLYKINLEKVDNQMCLDQDVDCDNSTQVDDETKEQSMRLFKIIGKYVVTTLTCRMAVHTPKEFYQLLPIACVLQTYDVDDEIKPLCTNLLAILSQTIVPAKHISLVFEIIRTIALCPLWSARAAVTEFMSSFIFHNMAILLSNSEWVSQIQLLVLDLLEDAQPEVRVNASKVLSGLLHCEFLPSPEVLLGQFKLKSKTNLRRIKKTTMADGNSNLRSRHAGVLGLCAFISSHPYEVPDYLPEVFGQLGAHLSDPQPIPTTIRKTLGDFKRTHQDNWEVHKLRFTEDELTVLQDLTVPPSYYA